jgi:hypothetical protein
MNFRSLLVLCFIILSALIISCGGGKSVTDSSKKIEAQKPASITPQTFTYRFHFANLGSMTKPHDEIWIDTSGQVTFNTHQHMKDGSWKSPRGFAYLEPKDEDTLLFFIRKDAMYSIEESDVSPQCPDGDQYTIRMSRSDLKKELIIQTNTCAGEYNLLTGDQRKLFPAFLAYIDRLRDRYRPLYTE